MNFFNWRDKTLGFVQTAFMNPVETAKFFLIYPVGLEEAGQRELAQKYSMIESAVPLKIIATIPGGIEIECPLHAGFKLNMVLKTPVRILLRLAEFKCRDFPKLFQKMSKFNWAPWMLGQTPEVECSSKNSRLFDSRKIEKAIDDGINQYYRHKPVKKKYLDHLEIVKGRNVLPKIYFRAEDDVVTLSLDTTGERLYMRGEKTQAGMAPIRENLASLLLTELHSHLDESPKTLIDPMCGSGTFTIEAKNYYKTSLDRDYAFMHLPVALDAKGLWTNIALSEKNLFLKVIGFDISPDVITQAKHNDPEGDYQVEDLMSKKSHDIKNAVVIVNPPYGIRVGENINLDFFLRALRSIKEKFQPELTGIIIPAEHKIYSNNEWTVLKSIPFKNGGIDVVFYLIK